MHLIAAVSLLIENYFFLLRFPSQQESWNASTSENGERQDPDRQHSDGHGQDQGVRIQGEGGTGVAGRRNRAGREGKDEGQGRLQAQVSHIFHFEFEGSSA